MTEQEIEKIVTGITSGFTPVIDAQFTDTDYVPIDLSEENTELDETTITSAEAMGQYIHSHLEKRVGKVAYGGYLEKRAIYRRSSHFNTNTAETERNIHLGVDLWVAAGTPVLAPVDGVVHSWNDNQNFGDYGPTIILKHQTNNFIFYTLYGHLSRESLQGLQPGASIPAGAAFARLGVPEVNGDYAPHLHFQVILDIGGYQGDYPGVTSQRELPHFQKNCPNPNLLLKIS